jgi:hypothetical protein
MLSINLDIGFNAVLKKLDRYFDTDTKCCAWRTFDVSHESTRLNVLIYFVIFTEWLTILAWRINFVTMDELDLEAGIGWMDDHMRLADNWDIMGELKESGSYIAM